MLQTLTCIVLVTHSGQTPASLGKQATQTSRPLSIEGVDARIIRATVSGPEFHPSKLFVGVERADSPLIKRLREEYRLEDVIKGETNEFRKLLKLRHWVHSRWHIDNDQNFNGDVFAILERAKAGEGFNCSHAMKVQHAVLTAMGFVVRDLGVQCNTEEYPDGFHHGVNEVWSNDFAKWILMDGEYDFHFERNGVPLSALEAHEAARAGAEGVVKVQGLDRKIVPMKGLGFPFTSIVGYWWTAYHVRQDTFTQPKGNESRLVIFDNDAFRQTTWLRKRGDNVLRKHWAYDAKAFVPTRDRYQIEWTPGVPALSVKRVTPDELDVTFHSMTPNFAAYEVRLNAGPSRDVQHQLRWKLAQGENTLVVRTRNTFGVLGPEVTAVVSEPAGNARKEPVVWNLDNLKSIGGHKVTVVGKPRVIDTDRGKAIEFDGRGDGLFVAANPLAGLREYTVEVIFRPAAGGHKEQRFLHFQPDGNDDRVLFETRLTPNGRWFLDTYLQTAKGKQTLYAEKFLHPLGAWHHAAIVVDGKSMRHYVNGQEELAAQVESAPLAAGQTSIGMRFNKVFWYQGAIRQIRVTPALLKRDAFLKP